MKLCWQSFPDPGSARGPLRPHTALRRSRVQPAMTDTTAEEAHNSCWAWPSLINTSLQWRPISLTLANSAISKIDLIQLFCNGLSYWFYRFLCLPLFFVCVLYLPPPSQSSGTCLSISFRKNFWIVNFLNLCMSNYTWFCSHNYRLTEDRILNSKLNDALMRSRILGLK